MQTIHGTKETCLREFDALVLGLTAAHANGEGKFNPDSYRLGQMIAELRHETLPLSDRAEKLIKDIKAEFATYGKAEDILDWKLGDEMDASVVDASVA